MRPVRNIHFGTLLTFIVLFLLGFLAFPSTPSRAQVEVHETLWMSDGEKETVYIDFPYLSGNYYRIRVYKEDGSWEGQKISARARQNSGGSCDFNLIVMPSYYRSDEGYASFTTYDGWSDWAVLWGVSQDEYFDVEVIPTGACQSSNAGQVEVEIVLGEVQTPVKTPTPTPTTYSPPIGPVEPPPSGATFTAGQYMNCRTGPDASYDNPWHVNAGDTVPALARWSNGWILVGINDSRTRTKCCWVGGQGELNVPLTSLPEINFLPDRITCELPFDVPPGGVAPVPPTSTPTPYIPPTPTNTPYVPPTPTNTPRPPDTSEPVPSSTFTPRPKELTGPTDQCDPYNQIVILIVTHSAGLNRSTGVDNAWQGIRQLLEDYYSSGMSSSCEGMPVFLDVADVYPSGPPDAYTIRSMIRDEVDRLGLSSPYNSSGRPLAAIAIIGGPDVIPVPLLQDPTNQSSYIYSDNFYADLHPDAYQRSDTVITRLPDGRSEHLMINYIQSLMRNSQPLAGSVVVAGLQTSAHRTSLNMSYVSGSTNVMLNTFLDTLLEEQTGSVTYLISPVWSATGYARTAVDQRLIRLDDLMNSMTLPGNTSISSQLNREQILFQFLIPGQNNSAWYAVNVASGAQAVRAMDVSQARQVAPGTNILALHPNSADIVSGDQYVNNSIPLAMLASGVRSYIGSTTSLYFSWINGKNYGGSPNTVFDIDIGQTSGALAQYYYRFSSPDPATSLMAAKNLFADQHTLSNPFNYKTYHAFTFLGLPSAGQYPGVYVSVDYMDTIPLQQYDPPPATSGCPSGFPDDCDADGLSDDLEFQLAEANKPYLVFDEGEDAIEQGIPPVVHWQASPGELGGRNGIFLTYVFTYRKDFGIHDIDISLMDRASCRVGGLNAFWDSCITDNWFDDFFGTLGSCVGATTKGTVGQVFFPVVELVALLGEADINFNQGQWLLGHAGDTEAIRYFLQPDGSGNWRLTHIDWKRHHEGFGTDDSHSLPQPVEQAVREGLVIHNNHPTLYVSENKHAMYPTHSDCEAYPYELFTGCEVQTEHCSGEPYSPFFMPVITANRNVGEHAYTRYLWTTGGVQQTYHLLDALPDFLGEFAWEMASGEEFCGGFGYYGGGVADEPCAGPMGKMWYDPVNRPYR